MDKIFQIYDRAYKQLFSNKTIFKQLIQSFVHEPWVEQINFDDIERIDKSFISQDYAKTESDIIYKLNFNDQDIYIYVLLEFQSSIDKFMSVRCLNYITNFYLDMVKSKGEAIKLPPIFPLVLYNGDDKWNYSTEISDLIDNNKILGDYSLNFRYFLIKENSYSVEELMKIGNIVSTLFLSEIKFDIELLSEEVLKIYDKEEDKIAIKLFLNLFQQLSLNEKIDKVDYNILEETYRNKEEVKSMLVIAARKERERISKEAREEGLAEGENKAKSSYVIRLLTKKFKSLPEELENNINNCVNTEIFDQIIDSIFDITSLDEIKKYF